MIGAILLLMAAGTPKVDAPPPIVRFDTPAPPTWTFQQWKARDDGDSSIASTLNEAGSAFGAICGKDCVWFVNVQKECVAGDLYPAMINGPKGSYAIQLKCYHGADNRRLLTFPMDETSTALVSSGGVIGFAFPLGDGKFGVSRFSLDGATEAVVKAIEVITTRRKTGQEGLRDFTI